MSTRSSIAIKRKDGTIESVYCHSDGYLEYNGIMLDKFYRNQEKINSLINLGDLSFLDRRVNPEPDVTHSFDFDKRQEGVTVAYGRDRNDKNTQKKIHKNLSEYTDYLFDSWLIYAYLYDEENSKWLWSRIPHDNIDNIEFISLEDTLKEKGLKEKIDPSFDKIVQQEANFEKSFDIETYNDCYESDEDAYYDFQELLSTPKGIKGHLTALQGYIDDITYGTTEFTRSVSKDYIKIINNNIKNIKKYAREKYPDFDSIEFPDI